MTQIKTKYSSYDMSFLITGGGVGVGGSYRVVVHDNNEKSLRGVEVEDILVPVIVSSDKDR